MATFANAVVVENRWTGRTKDRAGYLRALEPGDATARKDLETMVLGLPHFVVTGTTDTNTADSDAINLSDMGVTFPAATMRHIRVRAYVSQGSETGFIEHVAAISGADGTTPEVDGQVALVNLTDAVDATNDPAIDVEVAANEVIIEAVGDTTVNTRWYIEVYVGEIIPLAFLADT